LYRVVLDIYLRLGDIVIRDRWASFLATAAYTTEDAHDYKCNNNVADVVDNWRETDIDLNLEI